MSSQETEKLENEKSRLEEEIKVLEIQKCELQNILDSHSIDCTNTVKEEKSYFDTRGINSGFGYHHVGLPYGVMEDPLTVNGTDPSQYKGMAPSNYLYPSQTPAGFGSKSVQYKNNHFNGSAINKNDYKNLNNSHFAPSFTEDSQQSYPPQLDPSNPFPISGNSNAVDLSNSDHGFRTVASDPRQPNHDPRGYMGVYKHSNGQDQGVRYADISCLKAVSMKSFNNDQDLSKSYQNNNNNNYMGSHSSMFYKNTSDAYAESCLVAANSNNFHYEDKSSCSRAYPSPLENFKPGMASSCLPKSVMRASPCYQKTLESVLKVENQCGMGLQVLSHHSTS